MCVCVCVTRLWGERERAWPLSFHTLNEWVKVMMWSTPLSSCHSTSSWAPRGTLPCFPTGTGKDTLIWLRPVFLAKPFRLVSKDHLCLFREALLCPMCAPYRHWRRGLGIAVFFLLFPMLDLLCFSWSLVQWFPKCLINAKIKLFPFPFGLICFVCDFQYVWLYI